MYVSRSSAVLSGKVKLSYRIAQSDADLTIPFDSGGQGKSGVDLGPNALVERGLLSQLSELGWNVHYEGPAEFDDIPYINPNQPGTATKKEREVLPDPDIGRMKKPRLVSAVNQRAMEIIRDHAMEGRLPLTLGGDHSLVSRDFWTMLRMEFDCSAWRIVGYGDHLWDQGQVP